MKEESNVTGMMSARQITMTALFCGVGSGRGIY